MLWRWRGSERGRDRRSRLMSVETMEGRVLLSAVPAAAASRPRPIEIVLAARQARLEERAAKLAALRAARAHAPVDPNAGRTITGRGEFALKTATKGWTLAHSKAVQRVGLSYAKLAFGQDTRKVGWSYLRAALQGNDKALKALGHTNLVKEVGNEFTQLSHSKPVDHVGTGFARFGSSVSHQFNRLFGHRSKPAK